MQAVMEITDGQEFLSWQLPKNWTVVLSSNPDNGDYLVSSLDEAMTTRYINYNTKFDIKTWGRWAEEEGVDSRAITFLMMNPNLVKSNTNPRIITKFFDAISSIENYETELPRIQMIGEGSVGSDFAGLFIQHINNRLDRLVSPATLMDLELSDKKVQDYLKESVGEGVTYRAHIAAVIADRLLNYNLALSKNSKGSIDAKTLDRLLLLLTVDKSLTQDLKLHIVKGLIGEQLNYYKNILAKSPELSKQLTIM